MRAMVLAAGLGTRLRPMTSVLPKPAVPVVHRPVVGYLLHAIAAAGVREVMLNLHHLPEAMKAVLGDGSAYGLKLHYSHEPEILGTGGAVREVASFLGDGPCLLLNGDFLIEVDLSAVIREHRAARHADERVVATMVVREDPSATRYGALGLDGGGRIVDFVGRAKVPEATVLRRGLFTGIHVLEAEMRRAIPADGAPCINKTAYPALIEEGRVVRGFWQRGHWSDIGTPGGYLQANLDVLEGRVSMAGPDPRQEGAVFVRPGEVRVLGGARVIGPASIADDAILGVESMIGPGVVIGRGSNIGPGAHLSRAVVWQGAHVLAQARIDGAIVWGEGAGSEVTRAEPRRGDPGR